MQGMPHHVAVIRGPSFRAFEAAGARPEHSVPSKIKWEHTPRLRIGLILYVVLTTAVSFFLMARVRKPADYLVAGRGLPFWVLTGTIIGTCIGTGVIIGGSGLAYQHGWAGCAYPIGLGLGTLLTGLFFAKMRRYKFMTLSEEVACYYEGNRVVMEFSNISLCSCRNCAG